MQNIYVVQSNIDTFSRNLQHEGLSYACTGFWFREHLSSPSTHTTICCSYWSLDFLQRVIQKGCKKGFTLNKWLINKTSFVSLHLPKHGVYGGLDVNTVILGAECLLLIFLESIQNFKLFVALKNVTCS